MDNRRRISFGYRNIVDVGNCLKNGELVLSPFEEVFEEEKTGDPDLRDDDLNFTSENLCVTLEPELGHKGKDIRKLAKEYIFKFFLDGSLRTKYIGEYCEGRLSSPVIVSEIGVATVERESQKIKPFILNKRQYIIFPHKDSGLITDTTYDKLNKLKEKFDQEEADVRVEFLQKTAIVRDVKYSMLGKARNIMHNFEHEVATSFERSNDEWLVMDGAIRTSEFMKLQNTIGLAKSFSRRPILDFCNGKKPLMLPFYLRHIREGQRSAVFRVTEGGLQGLVFWYIRLRSLPQIEPLEGVVKVDFNLGGDSLKSIDVDLVDKISHEIYSLQNPSIYPNRKWLSTIYPIRVAEECLRCSFTPKEILVRVGGWLKRGIRS